MGRGGRIGNLYRPLNQGQIETIHQKSLDVIEHIGLTFETDLDDMLDMIEEAGCKVDRKKARIYFPRKLVEEMVAQAPAEFILYSRDGKNDLHLGGDRVYAGTGGSAVKVLDLDTGQVRQGLLKDIYNVARLVDQLDNIHFFNVVSYRMMYPSNTTMLILFFFLFWAPPSTLCSAATSRKGLGTQLNWHQ